MSLGGGRGGGSVHSTRSKIWSLCRQPHLPRDDSLSKSSTVLDGNEAFQSGVEGSDLKREAPYRGCLGLSIVVQEYKVGDAPHPEFRHLRSPLGILYVQHHEVDLLLEFLLCLQSCKKSSGIPSGLV